MTKRVVSDAGIALVATLADRLGIEPRLARLGRDRRGASAGRNVMALVFTMVLGADSIDDTDVLRAGRVAATRSPEVGVLTRVARLLAASRALAAICTFGHRVSAYAAAI